MSGKEDWKSTHSQRPAPPGQPNPWEANPDAPHQEDLTGTEMVVQPTASPQIVPPSEVSAVLAERLAQLQQQTQEDRMRSLTVAMREALPEGIQALPDQINSLQKLLEADQKTRSKETSDTRVVLEQGVRDIKDLKARPLARAPSKLPWIVTSLAILALVTAGVMYHGAIRSALASLPMVTLESSEKRMQAREELAKLTAQLEAVKSQLSKEQAELEKTRRDALDATAALQASMQARTQAQMDMGTMENLKQRHRTGLMPGQNGKLYAEVSENPAPFLYSGRWYIEVKEVEKAP